MASAVQLKKLYNIALVMEYAVAVFVFLLTVPANFCIGVAETIGDESFRELLEFTVRRLWLILGLVSIMFCLIKFSCNYIESSEVAESADESPKDCRASGFDPFSIEHAAAVIEARNRQIFGTVESGEASTYREASRDADPAEELLSSCGSFLRLCFSKHRGISILIILATCFAPPLIYAFANGNFDSLIKLSLMLMAAVPISYLIVRGGSQYAHDGKRKGC